MHFFKKQDWVGNILSFLTEIDIKKKKVKIKKKSPDKKLKIMTFSDKIDFIIII